MSDAATRVKARKVEGVQRILNCLPSPQQEEDWSVDSAKEAGMLAARAALPEKVDLRESWWKVGDQGSTGSCVGWAAADSVLRWHLVTAGHAVALVGYDANYFIVRNSWGTANWGDKGFGYATNEYTEAAFTEAYGVTL